MGQKTLDYSSLFCALNDTSLRYKSATILTGQGALLAGTVLILQAATKKYIVMANTTDSIGAVVLAEDADTSGGDATAKVLLTGGVDEDKLVFEGVIAAFDESVRAIFAMNNIHVLKFTNNITNV